MTEIIYPVLLCGGSGTRLWPLSRRSFPKQFVKLMGEQSLFQASAQRLSGDGFAAPSVVTGADFRFVVIEQLAAAEIVPGSVLVESEARSTAAAVCATALRLQAQSGDVLMLVAPSDHVVPNAESFRQAVRAATPAARDGQLMTFGIHPTRPETGYGWLELAEPMQDELDGQPKPLKSFIEKPDQSNAEALLADGRHLWNAGILMFSTQAILDAFSRYAPNILEASATAVNEAEEDLSFTRLAPGPWSKAESISIDYAVMERAKNLSVQLFPMVGLGLIWATGVPSGHESVEDTETRPSQTAL